MVNAQPPVPALIPEDNVPGHHPRHEQDKPSGRDFVAKMHALAQEDAYEAIFHPIAEQVLARCDACLRIGGPSEGADRMVATARRLGKAVFKSIAEVPTP